MGLIRLARTGLSSGERWRDKRERPSVRGWGALLLSAQRIPGSKRMYLEGGGQGESDSQTFHGFLHAFVNVQPTSQLGSAPSVPGGCGSGGVSNMPNTVALSRALFLLTAFL